MWSRVNPYTWEIEINDIDSDYIYTNTLNATQIINWTLLADIIESNSIDSSKVSFWYAGSDYKWWTINNWFTSLNLSSVLAPDTWVKIDNTWIKMYSWWTEKISIWSNWNATFQWDITASTISWTTISWTTITWTTITWWIIETASSNRRIKISWSDNKILAYDDNSIEVINLWYNSNWYNNLIRWVTWNDWYIWSLLYLETERDSNTARFINKNISTTIPVISIEWYSWSSVALTIRNFNWNDCIKLQNAWWYWWKFSVNDSWDLFWNWTKLN